MLQELDRFSLALQYTHEGVFVEMAGILSLETTNEFKRKMADLLNDGTLSLTIDIAGIRHIDSVGLATLILLSRDCVNRGVKFSLSNPAEAPGRLLQSTGLAKYLILSK